MFRPVFHGQPNAPAPIPKAIELTEELAERLWVGGEGFDRLGVGWTRRRRARVLSAMKDGGVARSAMPEHDVRQFVGDQAPPLGGAELRDLIREGHVMTDGKRVCPDLCRGAASDGAVMDPDGTEVGPEAGLEVGAHIGCQRAPLPEPGAGVRADAELGALGRAHVGEDAVRHHIRRAFGAATRRANGDSARGRHGRGARGARRERDRRQPGSRRHGGGSGRAPLRQHE